MLKGKLLIEMLSLKESHNFLTVFFSEIYMTAEIPSRQQFYQGDDFAEFKKSPFLV